jgi:hypothetical protein
MFDTSGPIKAARIEEAIAMLEQYLDVEAIAPLLERLRRLAERPEDEARLQQLFETLDELGIMQGAVLTYAPYLAILLSERQAKLAHLEGAQQDEHPQAD